MKQYRLQIHMYNLYYTVKVYDRSLYNCFNSFKFKLSTFKVEYDKKTRRYKNKLEAQYYLYDTHKEVYRLPIKSFKLLLMYLKNEGVNKEEIDYQDHRKEIAYGEFNYGFHAPFEFREEQVKYLDAIKENLHKTILLIDAQTGSGKSLMMAYTISYLKIKPAFILLPKYIEKWIDDCKLYFKANREDICVIQGADTLLKLLSTPSKDLKYQIYIFSLPTLDSYFKSYEAGEALFPLTPDEVMKHINAGILINDETHNSFRQLTTAMLYLDAKYMLCSSASFDSNNRSLKNLYKTVIPPENRISNLAKIERYVNVKAIRYDLRVTKGIRFKRSQGYNHILYEESIMKFTFLKLKYFAMVEYYLNDIYFKKRQSLNDKVAIFFASIAMCDEFTGYLASRYPNENIYKYVGGTSYGDMLNSNIIISNHQMLGTGIDVKGLIGVIQTVSTASLQANIQNFGRLRKIPDREIWYYYLFNFQLGRQKQMANERYEAIKDKIKSYYGEEYSIKLNG